MDNGRMKRTLEVDLGDLLVLRDALQIGATTAMMCSRDTAEARLRDIQAQIEALIENEIAVLGEVFDSRCVCEIVAKMQRADRIVVRVIPMRGDRRNWWSSWSEGRIEVLIISGDDVSSYTQDGFDRHSQDSEVLTRVQSALKALAPFQLEEQIEIGVFEPEKVE